MKIARQILDFGMEIIEDTDTGEHLGAETRRIGMATGRDGLRILI